MSLDSIQNINRSSEIGSEQARAKSLRIDKEGSVTFKQSNVLKMLIVAYTDKTMQDKIPSPSTFYIPINPESIKRDYRSSYEERRGHGNQGTDPRYVNSHPEQISLDFTLDGTQSIEGYVYQQQISSPVGPTTNNYQSVSEQINALKNIIYTINKDTHKPNHLKLFWGKDFVFPCILTNLNINFTLFDREGNALRAKINATFKKYIEPKSREIGQGNQSPDISHVRIAKQGDRLDLMTYRIYNTSQYVLQVASANGLSTIRNIGAGTEIYFPPIVEEELAGSSNSNSE